MSLTSEVKKLRYPKDLYVKIRISTKVNFLNRLMKKLAMLAKFQKSCFGKFLRLKSNDPNKAGQYANKSKMSNLISLKYENRKV